MQYVINCLNIEEIYTVFFAMPVLKMLCCLNFIETHTQLSYGSLDFVRDNLGEPVPEETFTHSHLLWSPIIPYLLPVV